MESTHSPIMLLVVIVAEGFLFLPLRFWVQVAHPLKTQHHIKVGDLECALHPGRWHQILSSYLLQAGASAVFLPSLSVISLGQKLLGGIVCNRMSEPHGQAHTNTSFAMK